MCFKFGDAPYSFLLEKENSIQILFTVWDPEHYGII